MKIVFACPENTKTLKLASCEVFVFSKACTVVEYQNLIYFLKQMAKVLIWEPKLFFTEYENVEQVFQGNFLPCYGFH